MRGLDFGLKDANQSGLDFGMDESYSDFISKKMSKVLSKRAFKSKVLRKKLKEAEKRGDDKQVITLNNRLERIALLPKTANKRFFGKKGKEMIRKQVSKKMAEKNCVDRLKTMRLTQEGMEDFIAKCEAEGDFSASKIKKKEKIADELLVNEVVKQERVEDRVEDEITATEEAVKEATKPVTQKKGFEKKILPIVAICGIVFLIIKKF